MFKPVDSIANNYCFFKIESGTMATGQDFSILPGGAYLVQVLVPAALDFLGGLVLGPATVGTVPAASRRRAS